MDSFQTLPDCVDDPYMFLATFSLLARAEDRVERIHHRPLLAAAITKARAAARFAMAALTPNPLAVTRGSNDSDAAAVARSGVSRDSVARGLKK